MTHAWRNEEHPFCTDAEYAAAGDPFADSQFQIWQVGAKWEIHEGDAVLVRDIPDYKTACELVQQREQLEEAA